MGRLSPHIADADQHAVQLGTGRPPAVDPLLCVRARRWCWLLEENATRACTPRRARALCTRYVRGLNTCRCACLFSRRCMVHVLCHEERVCCVQIKGWAADGVGVGGCAFACLEQMPHVRVCTPPALQLPGQTLPSEPLLVPKPAFSPALLPCRAGAPEPCACHVALDPGAVPKNNHAMGVVVVRCFVCVSCYLAWGCGRWGGAVGRVHEAGGTTPLTWRLVPHRGGGYQVALVLHALT